MTMIKVFWLILIPTNKRVGLLLVWNIFQGVDYYFKSSRSTTQDLIVKK